MREHVAVGLCILMACLGGNASAQGAASTPERFVVAARELLGVPYEFGGRLRKPGEGIDCQGVLFYAAERTGRCGWKSFSVMPTQAVPSGELGLPVEGLSPVASSELDVSRLDVGDMLFLVGFDENPAEPSIAALKGRAVWVWHTGVYSGEGRWIVGDHFAGKVVEVDLRRYLAEHSDTYAGVMVLRMAQGPKPLRCRQHALMPAPKGARVLPVRPSPR